MINDRHTVFIISKLNPTSLGVARNLEDQGKPYRVLNGNLENYILSLKDIPKNPKIFLVPTSDGDNQAIERHYQYLHDLGIDALPSLKDLRLSLDKYIQYSALSSKRIRTPHTQLIDVKNPETIQFKAPCILKPCFSGDWKTDYSFKVIGDIKAVIVNTQSDLAYWIKKVSPVSDRLVLQEVISQKKDENYSFCGYAAKEGRVIWGFLTQKILQYPEGFGTALLCRTIEDEDLFRFGEKTVESLGIEGIFEIEIIRNQHDDHLYVIEINLRHWSQHRLSTLLGINLTLMDYYYRTKDREMVDRMLANAKKGNCLWIDDVGYLIHCIKKNFHPNACRFSALLGSRIECGTFSLKDLRPFARSLASKLGIKIKGLH